MKNITPWITRIESASHDELEVIKLQWSIEGRKYNPNDWYKFWESFTNRKLILNGHQLTDPAF